MSKEVLSMIRIIKKDGTLEPYNEQKIVNACKKSAARALDNLSDNDYKRICDNVMFYINSKYDISASEYTDIPVSEIHANEIQV